MDIVIIPAWARPGFLAVTLEQIEKADGFRSLFYLFNLDVGYNPEIEVVIMDFIKQTNVQFEINRVLPTGYTVGKQSFALMCGYQWAIDKLEAQYIHLIEDDIFIRQDYFRWHYAVHADCPDIFCSIASRNNNANDPVNGREDGYYLKGGDYQSLGVCWSRRSLAHVLSYVEDAYFRDPVSFCAENFPNSKIGRFYAEQGGLIRRILEKKGAMVAWPHKPRCFHAGFEGYNRRGKEILPLELNKQVEFIKKVCFSDEAMRQMAVHPEHYLDSSPIDMEVGEWTTQTLQ